MDQLIAIGIFAHNEAQTITDALQSLREQTVFQQAHPPMVVILENGSRDQTATIARQGLEQMFAGIPFRVESLPVGDKGLAWNHFVHQAAPASVKQMIFMDADITFGNAQVLQILIDRLNADDRPAAAVSQAVKDIARKEQPDLIDKLSLASSAREHKGPSPLCGSLYAARAEDMRELQVPAGLLVEDGFLRAAISTKGFARPADETRIMAAPGAFHYFEAVTQLYPLFRHERRLAIGTTLNIMLFAWAREQTTLGTNLSDATQQRNAQNPHWVRDMALEKIQSGKLAFNTWEYAFKQYRIWRKLPPTQKLRVLPGFLAHSILNAAAALSARRIMRRGQWQW